MGIITDERRVTCNDCGYSGTFYAVSLHSCDIQEHGGCCEDWPSCGHLWGECQTLPEHTSEWYLANPAKTHLGCDHNTGYCEYEEEIEDE